MTEQLESTELEIFVTAVRDAAGSRTGEALDAALEDIGWSDALPLAPRAAVESLFEAQGAACGTSGALGKLLLSTLGLAGVDGVDGAVDSRVALPAFGGVEPPAAASGTTGVHVRGLGCSQLARAERAVLLRGQADGAVSWATVPVATLMPRPVQGLDPDAALVEIETIVEVDPTAWTAAAGVWPDAVALARLAVGHELVGTMRTMVELARTHALERVQFDRPIAGFQAVRHRLAEAFVAVEASSAALDGAWTDRSPLTAAIAKAACGQGAATVRRHCQQVLAGIGFTTEHDLHRYVRRSILLDGLLGDARSLTEQLGRDVLERRALSDVLPL